GRRRRAGRRVRARRDRAARDGLGAHVLLDEALDLGRADATLEARDRALLLHEHDGRDDLDAELRRELGLRVDVDAGHAQALALLPRRVGDQTAHPPRLPRRRREKEDQTGSRVAPAPWSSLSPAARNAPPPPHLHWQAVGGWYWIGVAVGFGVAIGVFAGGVLGASSVGTVIAAVLAAALGGLAGWQIGGMGEVVGGAVRGR